MKSATIFNYKDSLLFVTNHRFSDGIVRMTSEIELCKLNESITTITALLKSCLNKFNVGEDYRPEKNQEFQLDIAGRVGVKKYKEFVKDSNMIKLVDIGNEIKLQPLKSTSKFNGYESYKGIIQSFEREDLENGIILKRVLNLFEVMKREKES